MKTSPSFHPPTLISRREKDAGNEGVGQLLQLFLDSLPLYEAVPPVPGLGSEHVQPIQPLTIKPTKSTESFKPLSDQPESQEFDSATSQ